jgi:hypothetical protein
MATTVNTAITAIIVLVVILIIGVVVSQVAPEAFKEITNIATEVFRSEEIAREEATEETVEAYNQLVEEIDKCTNVEKRNCLCGTGPFGTITEGYKISILNDLSSKQTQLTVETNEQEPERDSIEQYNLGFFVVYESGDQRKLGCYFPKKFTLNGIDESEEINNWYASIPDSRAKGKLYFYNDKPSDDHEALNKVPSLYKVGDKRLCMLTTLLEVDPFTIKQEDTKNMELNIADIESDSYWYFWTQTAFESVNKFFDDSQACAPQ